MKFLSLEIQNFLAVGHGRVKLDERGLCLIQGVNHDDSSATSNGVGKSTIPDALCWALYGVTARGVSGDAVVNKTAKKETSVIVMLRDGHSTYSIERYRKHPTMKNQTRVTAVSPPSHTCVELTKGTEKDTQEVINQIMGCSLEVFVAAIYAGQEEMPDLPKMTDKQLKLLIEESAGVARLENAYAAAREKMNSISGKVDHKTRLKADLTERLLDTKSGIVSAQNKFDEFEDGRSVRKSEALNKASEIKKVMLEIVADIKGYDEASLKGQVEEIDKQLADHDKVSLEQKRLLNEFNRVEKHYNYWLTHLEFSLNEVKSLKATLDNAEESIKKACPSCGKPGDEHDLSTYKEHVAARLKEAVLKAKEMMAEKEKASELMISCRKEYDEFTATIPDISAISTRRSAFTLQLTRLTSKKSEILMKNKDYLAMNDKAFIFETESNPHKAVIEHLRKTESDIEVKISKVDADTKVLHEELNVAQSVVKVFGPAGVRAHILDTVTPFLNERTADYLSALSDGNISAVWSTLSTTAKGDLKEKFNIEVMNDKGAESFAGLSGGEKRKVRIATMLALQDLVASRATKSIELYIADEVDDALDPAGLERLMGVLDRKARERGTVLVISHNSLTDWIDQVCTVTKKDGLSTIEGALSE